MLLKQRPQFAVRDVSCRHDEQRAWLAREQMALSEVSVLGDKYPLVVISDAGIRGLTVQNRAEGLRISAEEGTATAESGVPMARLATESQNR